MKVTVVFYVYYSYYLLYGSNYIDSDEQNLEKHCKALLRFTYRKDIPILSPYNITSDSGWGCMLRSAQSLMGNVLLRHVFGESEDYSL